MADGRHADATEADRPQQTDDEGTVRAKRLSERDTIPEFPAQPRTRWQPVPPRLLALSERKRER